MGQMAAILPKSLIGLWQSHTDPKTCRYNVVPIEIHEPNSEHDLE